MFTLQKFAYHNLPATRYEKIMAAEEMMPDEARLYRIHKQHYEEEHSTGSQIRKWLTLAGICALMPPIGAALVITEISHKIHEDDPLPTPGPTRKEPQ